MTSDNPLVRADLTCPLCLGDKDDGLLACWSCYRQHGFLVAILLERERLLARAWWKQ